MHASFQVQAGKTLAIVGESGSGKTTLARSIMGLLKPRQGSIFFENENIYNVSPLFKKYIQSQMQIVFQDPLASLNPMMNVREILEEPLLTHRSLLKESERNQKINDAMDRVGLAATDLQRYPHTFSGGQCQRIAIARAIILEPKILVCDEPVSALDVSVQAQILKLLLDLQQQMGMALVFISHNLAVVKLMAHSVCVMYKGRILEQGDTDKIFSAPQHPYTRDLIAAVPVPVYPPVRVSRPPLKVAFQAESGSECIYLNRCRYRKHACRLSQPPLEDCGVNHKSACIFANKLL
jgi:oligopeptide transport system ATP-binding protein